MREFSATVTGITDYDFRGVFAELRAIRRSRRASTTRKDIVLRVGLGQQHRLTATTSTASIEDRPDRRAHRGDRRWVALGRRRRVVHVPRTRVRAARSPRSMTTPKSTPAAATGIFDAKLWYSSDSIDSNDTAYYVEGALNFALPGGVRARRSTPATASVTTSTTSSMTAGACLLDSCYFADPHPSATSTSS